MSLRKLSTNSLGDKNRTFLLNVPDGSNMQIQLPPISKSSTDQKQLTIWPGRSNSSKIQLRKNIGVTSHEILEEKLNDQINKLMKTNESKSHLAHLQIHDEIFELCLQQFETFRPLLTRIKHSYNQTINYLQHEVQSLLPLKQTLVTMVEKAEKRLIHYKEQERQEIVELKRLCQEKDHKINLLSEDKLQMNLKVEKLSHQLGEEYKAFRMEAEARKLLITEINELRYRQDDKSIHSQSGTGKDDPKLLKIALQKCREDLNRTVDKVIRMETEYRNVVPKSEFEELSKNFNDLNEEVKLVKEHVDEITTENDRLITAVDTLTTERDEYYNESETLKRTSTPRPQWDKYGEMFSNKQEWKKAVENDSSIVLLDNLLNDLTSIETHPQQQFQPNETEQNVPIFLKTTDSIYNRRLSQRDAHYFIKQFWIERIKNRSSIEDFVEHYWNYSKSKFPSESMALEWTYNINVTCKRLKNNVFLQLFWRISNDKEEEYSYYHFKNCLVYLEEQLLEEEKSLLRPKSAEQEKTLQLKSVQDIIMKAFPEKSMTDTRKLTEILKEKFNETEMNAQIPFQQIFVEEDDDRLPDFHSTFLEQIFTEKNKYVNNYFEKYFQNENHLTKEKFLETIKQYDEKLSELELERYVKWLFPTNIDRLNLLTGKTKCLLMCIFPHREEVVDEKVDDEEIVQNESEIN